MALRHCHGHRKFFVLLSLAVARLAAVFTSAAEQQVCEGSGNTLVQARQDGAKAGSVPVKEDMPSSGTSALPNATHQKQDDRSRKATSSRFAYFALTQNAMSLVNVTQDMNCSVWIAQLAIRGQGMQVYSQGNQDGILQTIFRLIGTTNRRFVEFGFGYEGRNVTEEVMDHAGMGLNTRLLGKQGWNGLYFDAEISAPAFGVVKALLTEDNIGQTFEAQGVPKDVDYISLDVDSVDYWLLRALFRAGYKPRVLSTEFNPNFPGDALITFQPEWHAWTNRRVYGASAGALNKLASENGYVPVRIMHEMLDIFFVRRDVLEQHCNMATVPSYVELSSWLPQLSAHAPCLKEDVPRMLDLQLLLEGNREAASKKAMEIMKSVGMCDESAFS